MSWFSVKKAMSYSCGAFKAACFSPDARDYFPNSKKEAYASFVVPLCLLALQSWFLYLGKVDELRAAGSDAADIHPLLACAILFVALFLIAAPKFPILFGLIWRLCVYCKQTDHFWAFVVANNWFYIVYALLYLFKFLVLDMFIVVSPLWWKALYAYLALVTYFMACNVLRLSPEAAGLVPMAVLFTHFVVQLVTLKSGTLFVF